MSEIRSITEIRPQLQLISSLLPDLLPFQKRLATFYANRFLEEKGIDPVNVLSSIKDRFIGTTYAGYFTENWMRGIDPVLKSENLPTYSQYLSEIGIAKGYLQELAPWRYTYNSPFNDPTCFLDSYLESCVTGVDLKTRRRFAKGVVEAVTLRSQQSKERAFKVQKDGIVYEVDSIVVGGGPVGNTAIVQLGPTQETAYFTTDPWPGYNWYARGLLNQNSSYDQNDPYGKALPTLDGSTTNLLPFGMLNLPDLTRIARKAPDSRTIACEIGQRSYAGGEAVGLTNLLTAAAATPNLFTNMRLNTEFIEEDRNGVSGEAVDMESGNILRVRAKKIYIASGSGPEVCNVADNESELAYVRSKQMLKRQLMEKGPKKLELPKLLNLEMLGEALVYWIQECDANPELYPFDFFDENKSVAVLGDGDAAISVWKFLAGLAPESAYPEGFREKLAKPARRWLGFNRADDIDKLPRQLNKNITDVGLQRRSDMPDQVFRGRISQHRVTNYGENGQRIRTVLEENAFFDNYAIVCTGLRKRKVEDSIGSVSFVDATLSGNNSFVLGRKSRNFGRVHILGLANKFPADKLPRPFQLYLDTLGVDRKGNIAALWAWQYLSQLQVLQDMNTNEINFDSMDRSNNFDPYKLL